MNVDDTVSAPAGATEEACPVSLSTPTPLPLPDGEYAIAEILGHRTLIGRVSEVERFGAKLMSIEPIFAGALLPAVLVGGGSLYQYTACTRDTALALAPKHRWQLPASIAETLPPESGPIAGALPFVPDDVDDVDAADDTDGELFA